MKRHPDGGIRISFDEMGDRPIRVLKKAHEAVLRQLKGALSWAANLSRKGTLSCS